MTLYLYCTTCRRAWLGPTAASCCNARPLIVSPFSSDARVWFRARMSDRGTAVSERANLSDRRDLRASLWAGVMQRGRAVALGVAA